MSAVQETLQLGPSSQAWLSVSLSTPPKKTENNNGNPQIFSALMNLLVRFTWGMDGNRDYVYIIGIMIIIIPNYYIMGLIINSSCGSFPKNPYVSHR
jgi:hypothetical protein